MQFLYAFGVIFLLIFGMVMLVRVLVQTISDGCTRKFDVYIKADDAEEFAQNAREAPFIGEIHLIDK